MKEGNLYWMIAVIGLINCLLYAEKILAEPLRLNPEGCMNYAQDAGKIALSRDGGSTEEATQTAYAAMPYSEAVKPHLIELIRFIYSLSLTPQEAARAS